MTPGWKTTEFWTAIIAMICATVLCALGKIDAAQWIIVAGVSSGGYSVSRGLAKLKA